MACSSCGKNKVPSNQHTVSRSDAIRLRNEKQGYTKTTTITAPQKAKNKANQLAKLFGK